MSAATNIHSLGTARSSPSTATEGAPAAAPPAPSAACSSPSRRGSCFPKTPACEPASAPVNGEDELEEVADGLALLTSQRNRGGRPSVVDDQLKGKMVILLATGLSLRQTAAFLGITHPTVSSAIAADPELAADIADARVRAELHPLLISFAKGGAVGRRPRGCWPTCRNGTSAKARPRLIRK